MWVYTRRCPFFLIVFNFFQIVSYCAWRKWFCLKVCFNYQKTFNLISKLCMNVSVRLVSASYVPCSLQYFCLVRTSNFVFRNWNLPQSLNIKILCFKKKSAMRVFLYKKDSVQRPQHQESASVISCCQDVLSAWTNYINCWHTVSDVSFFMWATSVAWHIYSVLDLYVASFNPKVLNNYCSFLSKPAEVDWIFA